MIGDVEGKKMTVFSWHLLLVVALFPALHAQECPVLSSEDQCVVPLPAVGPLPSQYLAPRTTNGYFDWWYTLPYLITGALPTEAYPRGLIANFTTTFLNRDLPEDAVFAAYSDSYVMWAVSIIAVSCVGIFFGCMFLVAALIFYICVCCIANWKSRSSKSFGGVKIDPKRGRIKCLVCFFFAIAIVVFMLFGFVMACLCVWQYAEASTAFPSSIDQASSILARYFNDTELEYVREAHRGIDMAAGCIPNQLNGVPSAISSAVLSNFNLNENQQKATSDAMTLLQLQTNLQSTVISLSLIGNNVTTLLNSTLQRVLSLPQPLSGPELQDALNGLTSLPSVKFEDMQLELDLSEVGMSLLDANTALNQLSSQIEALSSSIITSVTPTQTVAVDSNALKDEISSQELESFLSEVSTAMEDQLMFQRDLFTLDTSVAQGYSSYASLRVMYDYGWSIAIAFCVFAGLSLLALVLIFFLAAVSYKSQPQNRTALSDLTRLALKLFVGYLFLFGFLFCIYTSLYFLVGAGFEKSCEAVSGPNYSGLDETLSNPEWREANLPPKVDGDENQNLMSWISSSNVTAANILSQCFSGATTWQVFDLEDQWMSSRIIDRLQNVTRNLEPVSNYSVGSLTTSLANANVSADVGSLSTTAGELQTAVSALQSSINATYLLSSVAMVTAARSALTSVQAALESSPQAGQMSQLSEISSSISTLLAWLTALETAGDNLQQLSSSHGEMAVALQSSVLMLGNGVSTLSTDVTTGATESAAVASAAVNCAIDKARNSTLLVEHAVYRNSSFCYPLWQAYDEVYTASCADFLGPINGFWFAMGWFMLGVLPIMIALMALSSHYKRLDIPRRRATSPIKSVDYRQSNLMTATEIEMYQNTWSGTSVDDNAGTYTQVTSHTTVVEGETVDAEDEASPYTIPVDTLQRIRSSHSTEPEVHQNEPAIKRGPPPTYEQLEMETEHRENLI